MRKAVVVEAVRTPIGRAHAEKGIYRDVRADDLSADLMSALMQRANVPASEIEDVHWGCVKQEREQGYDVARMASLIAGLPVEVGGVTVNRNCGSSLQAINQAAQSIAAECEDVQVAGGVEHMQHIPMEAGFDISPRYLYRHSQATLNMGLTAENLAIRYRISRREQDEFALRSHRRAAEATDSGAFKAEVIPTWGRDEEGRKQAAHRGPVHPPRHQPGGAGALKPAFMPEGGTVTAGNSSPLNVGAAALLIMSEERAQRAGPQAEGAHSGDGGGGRRSIGHGHRSGAGDAQGAGACRPEAGGHRPDRAQRGVRGPGAGGDQAAGAPIRRRSTSAAAPWPSATRSAPAAPASPRR